MEGGAEKKLGPGSFFSIPGGVKHTSGCAPGAPCVIFQQGPGKFDMKMVGGDKPAEKK
jgi:quercetin dioxygenase-like cupin family protein